MHKHLYDKHLMKLSFQKEPNASIPDRCYTTLFFFVSSPNKEYGVLFLFLIEDNVKCFCEW
jgi:hypothetical protein